MERPYYRVSEYDRERVTSDPVGESLTKQSEAESCDINVIMERAARGIMPDVIRQPVFGDFSEGITYHDAMNRVLEAQSSFMQLPAKVRTQFDNDPGLFLDFVSDPANASKLVEMGLAKPPEAVAPVVPAPAAPVANAPPVEPVKA